MDTLDLSDLSLRAEQHWPSAGRLCTRHLPDGEALVGVLELPPEFVPEEGRAYLLLRHASQISICPAPLDEGVPEDYRSCMGVGDLMTSPIWPKTNAPYAKVVRFLEAFPEQNRWTVFGVSNHPDPQAADHVWEDISARGRFDAIEPPADARGHAIGQLLSTLPVWPDGNGVLHSVPQLPAPLRQQYHRYHQLLAQSARDEDLAGRVAKVIATDPYLRDLSTGRPDPVYCKFLAALEDRGLLTLDAPQTAEAHERKAAVCQEVLREIDEPRVVARRSPGRPG